MNKTKTIEFSLNNEELKRIVNFNCHDADNIKISYKNFSEKEIEKKIISMGNVLNKLLVYLYSEPNTNEFPIETEDEKFWIQVEYNKSEISSVRVNTDEVVDVIKLLNGMFDVDIENALIDFVQLKIDELYMFRKHYGKGRAYFNYDLTIITEDIDTKVIKEYPVIKQKGVK